MDSGRPEMIFRTFSMKIELTMNCHFVDLERMSQIELIKAQKTPTLISTKIYMHSLSTS